MKSFEDYCGAGLLVLIVLCVGIGLISLLPTKAWVGIVVLGGICYLFTFLCYGLGRVYYYIMDKIQ